MRDTLKKLISISLGTLECLLSDYTQALKNESLTFSELKEHLDSIMDRTCNLIETYRKLSANDELLQEFDKYSDSIKERTLKLMQDFKLN